MKRFYLALLFCGLVGLTSAVAVFADDCFTLGLEPSQVVERDNLAGFYVAVDWVSVDDATIQVSIDTTSYNLGLTSNLSSTAFAYVPVDWTGVISFESTVARARMRICPAYPSRSVENVRIEWVAVLIGLFTILWFFAWTNRFQMWALLVELIMVVFAPIYLNTVLSGTYVIVVVLFLALTSLMHFLTKGFTLGGRK